MITNVHVLWSKINLFWFRFFLKINVAMKVNTIMKLNARHGEIAQLVSHLPLMLGTQVWIPVEAWLRSHQWEGKRLQAVNVILHPVSLTNWCIRLKTQYSKVFIWPLFSFSQIAYNKHYINSSIIWSGRPPLRPHVVTGMGATFIQKKIHVY